MTQAAAFWTRASLWLQTQTKSVASQPTAVIAGRRQGRAHWGIREMSWAEARPATAATATMEYFILSVGLWDDRVESEILIYRQESYAVGYKRVWLCK